MRVKKGKKKSIKQENEPTVLSPCGRPVRKARERHSAIPYGQGKSLLLEEEEELEEMLLKQEKEDEEMEDDEKEADEEDEDDDGGDDNDVNEVDNDEKKVDIKEEDVKEDDEKQVKQEEENTEKQPAPRKRGRPPGNKKVEKKVPKQTVQVVKRKRGRPRLRPPSSDDEEKPAVKKQKMKKNSAKVNKNVTVKMERLAGADMLEIGLRSLAKSRPESEDDVFGACASLLNKETLKRLNECYSYWQEQLEEKSGITLRGNMCLGTAAQIHSADRQIRLLLGWKDEGSDEDGDIEGEDSAVGPDAANGGSDGKKDVTVLVSKSTSSSVGISCEYCDKILKNTRLLKTHIRKFHQDEANVTSSPSKKKRKLSSPEEENVDNVGQGLKGEALKCKLCDYMGTKTALAKHNSRCHEPARFYCPHCSRGFSEQHDLRRHVKQHFDKSGKMKMVDAEIYKCEHCDFSATKGGLITHVRSAHGVSKNVYRCSGCSRMYTDAKLLSQHMISCKHVMKDLVANGEDIISKASPKSLQVKGKTEIIGQRVDLSDASLLMDVTEVGSEEDEPMDVEEIKPSKRGVLLKDCVLKVDVGDIVEVSHVSVVEPEPVVDESKAIVQEPEEEEDPNRESLCDFCGFKGAARIVKIHMTHVHRTKHPALFCPYCPRKFFLPPHRRKHVKRHLMQLSLAHKEFQCRCSYTANRANVVQHFINTHIRGEEPCGLNTEGMESTALPPPPTTGDEFNSMGLMEAVEQEISGFTSSGACILQLPETYPDNMIPVENKHVYCCQECGYIGTRRGALRHRRRYHSSQSRMDCVEGSIVEDKTIVRCIKCGFIGKHHVVKSHIEFYHSDSDVKCTVCEKDCKNEEARLKHQKNCGNILPKRVMKRRTTCNICSKRLASQYKLGRHMKRAHPDMCHSCNVCGKKFGLAIDLRIHMTYHGQQEDLVCDECQQLVGNAALLRKHIVQKHSTSSVHHCTVCWRQFKEKRKLKKHMYKHMPHATRFGGLCPVCNKAFVSASHLQDHVNCHPGLAPYTCDKCGQTFRMRSDYFIHLRNTHQRLYQCGHEGCERRFRSRLSLAEHFFLRHTMPNTHPCELCKQIFANVGEYQAHQCSELVPQGDLKENAEEAVVQETSILQPTEILTPTVQTKPGKQVRSKSQTMSVGSTMVQLAQATKSVLQQPGTAASILLPHSTSRSVLVQQKSLVAPILLHQKSGRSLLLNQTPQQVKQSPVHHPKITAAAAMSTSSVLSQSVPAPTFVLQQGSAAPTYVLQQESIPSSLKHETDATITFHQEPLVSDTLQQEAITHEVIQEEALHPVELKMETEAHADLQQESIGSAVLQQEALAQSVVAHDAMATTVLQHHQQHPQHAESVIYQEEVSAEATEVITETLESQAGMLAAEAGAAVDVEEAVEELFMCDLCKVIMRSMAEAQVHMETHHSLPALPILNTQ